MKFYLTLFLCLISGFIYAQSKTNDIQLIKDYAMQIDNHEQDYYHREGNDQKMMQLKNSSIFINKVNPLNIVFKSLMYLYQNVLSPQLSKHCPYKLSCSNFSKHLIRKYGLLQGVFLSADRINRCNRISLMDVNEFLIDENTGYIIDPITFYYENQESF